MTSMSFFSPSYPSIYHDPSIHPSTHPSDSGPNVSEPGDVANCLNTYFTAIGPKLTSEFLSSANNIAPGDYLTKIG